MKRFILVLGVGIIFQLYSCRENIDPNVDNSDITPIYIDTAATEYFTTVVNSIDSAIIPVLIRFPEDKMNVKGAVYIAHGSGGPWKDKDTTGDGINDFCNVGVPSKQSREWLELLTDNGFIAAVADSYSPRGTCENRGEYKDPPYTFVISSTFIRPGDAFAVAELLRDLHWEDANHPIINPEDVGMIGFSDGGTTAIATIFDQTAIPDDWEWSQRYDGVSYIDDVLPPVSLPDRGGFRFMVDYYGGKFHRGYYGNPCKEPGKSGSSIYRSSVPWLLHLPTNDPLTENALCLINTVEFNGGHQPITYFYEGVDHGFDTKDQVNTELARQRTLDFIGTFF